MLEAGVPLPAFFVMRLVKIDIEVDPFVVRRNLKLLVSLDVFEV